MEFFLWFIFFLSKKYPKKFQNINVDKKIINYLLLLLLLLY